MYGIYVSSQNIISNILFNLIALEYRMKRRVTEKQFRRSQYKTAEMPLVYRAHSSHHKKVKHCQMN
jgi:hypothetical protein